MKTIIALLLTMSSAFATDSLYTYDCHAEKGLDGINYLYLVQEKNGKELLINNKDRLFAAGVERVDGKYKDLYLYTGELSTIHISGVSLKVGYGMPSGTGSGMAYLVHEGQSYAYKCSIDWSPF